MQTARKLKQEVVSTKQSKKQLKVVKSRSRITIPDSSSMFSFLLMFATMLAIILIVNVSLRAVIAQGALQNKQLGDVYEKEQLKKQELLCSKTELSAPDRIEQIAVGKLGMVNPAEVNYLELPNEVNKQTKKIDSQESSESKRETPLEMMKNQVAGQISMSALRGLDLRNN